MVKCGTKSSYIEKIYLTYPNWKLRSQYQMMLNTNNPTPVNEDTLKDEDFPDLVKRLAQSSSMKVIHISSYLTFPNRFYLMFLFKHRIWDRTVTFCPSWIMFHAYDTFNTFWLSQFSFLFRNNRNFMVFVNHFTYVLQLPSFLVIPISLENPCHKLTVVQLFLFRLPT